MKRKELLTAILSVFLSTGTTFAADVIWYDGQHPVTVAVSTKTEPVVSIALDMFCSDMQQVTGSNAIVNKVVSQPRVDGNQMAQIQLVQLDKANNAQQSTATAGNTCRFRSLLYGCVQYPGEKPKDICRGQ